MPDEQVGNVLFRENTNRVIEHAVAIKRYNGIGIDLTDYGYYGYDVGNRQYCEWDGAVDAHMWRFNRDAYYIDQNGQLQWHNYVNLVCQQVP